MERCGDLRLCQVVEGIAPMNSIITCLGETRGFDGLNHHMAYEFNHCILGRYGAAVRKKIAPLERVAGNESARVGKGFSPQKFIQKFFRPGIQVNLQVHFHS